MKKNKKEWVPRNINYWKDWHKMPRTGGQIAQDQIDALLREYEDLKKDIKYLKSKIKQIESRIENQGKRHSNESKI